jgi:mannose-6-phosphate isomerase-like protein (cupin superfamily)
VDQIVLQPGTRLGLAGYPEERIYYVLDGRGALSVYDAISKGDLYAVRPDISYYFTPGLKHEILNTGSGPLILVVFRVTGGVVPTESEDGVASWPAVSKPGVTVANPAVGTGFWATYVFDEHSNPSVMEGQYLNVHALRLRRAQRITTAELLTIGPHSETRPHRHEDSDETFYILSGSGNLHWDGKTVPMKAGAVASLPVHGVRNLENTGDTPLQYIVLNTMVDVTTPAR